MPTCSRCGTAFSHRTYWESPEPCECGSNEETQPGAPHARPDDYEPTEDELEARRAQLDRLLRNRP